MSDTRLLLDGTDLDEVLARAAGLGGRVVRAERVRSGLLGRQRYEVTVAVPGPGRPVPDAGGAAVAARRPPDRQPRPAGIGDLIAAAEAAEQLESAAARQARAAVAAHAERGRPSGRTR